MKYFLIMFSIGLLILLQMWLCITSYKMGYKRAVKGIESIPKHQEKEEIDIPSEHIYNFTSYYYER